MDPLGSYVVLQLHVKHVDTVAATEMMLVKRGNFSSSLASWSQYILEKIGPMWQQRLECQLFPQLVQSRIPEIVEKSLRSQLTKRKFEFEFEILKEDQQARYFFDKLKEIQQVESDSDETSSDSSDYSEEDG